MFIDEAKITVSSGSGGKGMVHFRREKYINRGGPDGGDGGKGGDVVLVVSDHLNTLYPFRNQRLFKADNGKNGGVKKQTGKSGEDLLIQVPPGTIIYDEKTNDVIGDLVEDGQRLMVAEGGRAGRGNVHFANSRNKAPRIAEKGEPNTERELRLELKLIADIGIVGVPNAGKSTLLSVVTNAKPKIASYPFTTLQPNLGVAELDDHTSLVLADIPGLIEGAHQGVGLGFDFLRHIQRTRVIIHMIDGNSDDPIADFSQINSELALFDDDLGNKPQIVAVNKVDLPEVLEKWPQLEKDLKKRGYEPMIISAVARTNVRELLYKTAELLKATPKQEKAMEIPVYKPEAAPNDFDVINVDGQWIVKGISIERAAAMTYWEHGQSVRRFQKIMEVIGIDQVLREGGVKTGDTVVIGDHELEWED
jgi:GTP-binding protein